VPAERTSSLEAASDDPALAARAGRGDAQAFATLYDRHAPVVMALLQRMLRTAGEGPAPADVLQDVFLEAWQHVREYDPSKASVRTWLLVRARSRGLDALARVTRQRTAATTVRLLAEDGRDAKQARPSERSLAIRQGLAALDDDVRAVLELSYFQGFTAEEIASRVGAKLGTVKSRIARGLDRLGHLLDELEGDRT